MTAPGIFPFTNAFSPRLSVSTTDVNERGRQELQQMPGTSRCQQGTGVSARS